MRKYLNNPWIVTALALGAVAFVWSSLRPARGGQVAQTVESGGSLVEEVTTDASAPTEFAAMSIEQALNAVALTSLPVDPFAPRKSAAPLSLTEEPAVPDFVDTVKLSAIWTQEGRTYVVINDTIHEAGDEISRIRIESATQHGVWVAHWKGRDFVALGDDFTLVTPGGKTMTAAKL
jgi:hypothetical protein